MVNSRLQFQNHLLCDFLCKEVFPKSLDTLRTPKPRSPRYLNSLKEYYFCQPDVLL